MAKRKRVAESSSSRAACRDEEKKEKTGILQLPDDVFVDILTRIPMVTLHKNLIFVCRTWATIILGNPIFALHAEPGLFLQKKLNSSITRFLELKEGEFKLRNYKSKFLGEILGSSGGVALFHDYNAAGGAYHVVNPFTRDVMRLRPPHNAVCRGYNSKINIAVIPCSGIIKVVNPGYDWQGTYYWRVFTVGVDMSWRRISSTLQEVTDYHLYNEDLISVGGVMYSKFRWKRNSTDCYLHAIDLRDETTRYFKVPKKLGNGKSWLMEMGEHLCCVVQENPSWTVHNVWILKDLNLNLWVELYRIDVNFEENIGNHPPVPIGWLDNNQSLVFNVRKKIRATTSVIVAYNVKTGKKITCSKVDPSLFKVQLHKNTLLF